MSAKLVLILAVLNLVGCSESAKQGASDNLRAVGLPSLASKPPLTDADKIALLRNEAQKRGLRWKVFCTKWNHDPDWQYQADAWERGKPFSDIPFLPHYWGRGATQADAAYMAYEKIQSGDVTNAVERAKDEPYEFDKCAREKELHGE